MQKQSELEQVASLLKNARRPLFITGAGMSADSGLPTYRGIGGLYNNRLTDDDIPIEVVLSKTTLLHDPAITWRYLVEIELACRHAQFNTGHQIIAEIEKSKPETWVLTQNIDGFHRAAGSKNVIEIHGRYHDLYCVACDHKQVVESYVELAAVPLCPKCGALVRPNVILFEEALPADELNTLYQKLALGFDIIFSIGTTSVFPYIAAPVMFAYQQGIPTVEINPTKTEISHFVEYKIAHTAADTLEKIWDLTNK